MPSITPESLRDKITNEEDLQLIDVRMPFERGEFHIGGLHLPLQDIFDHLHLIATDKPVVIYCQKGIRSMIAIQRMEERHGFANLINLSGGIEGWKKMIKNNTCASQ